MDATIKEGNVGRSFSPVDKLKINLQNDGGESLWVPEDSVQLDELYTSTNGTYYAAPRDIYGWGVVTVDVDNSIDEPDDLYDDDEDQEEEPEGTWYFIYPDTDDRVDIEEDENGWYFIDPDTGDRVDIEEDDEGWYFIDPDTGERVDIEEDEDGNPYFIYPDTDDRVDIEEDENGWYFIDPDTGDRVDIEEDDEGWYFIDPDTGERVDIEEDEDGNPYFIYPDTDDRVDIEWDGEGEKPDNPWSPNSGGGGDGGDDEPGGGDEDQDDDSWDDWDDEPDEDWDEDGDEGDDDWEDDDWDEDDWEEEDDDWGDGDDEWGDDGITDGDDYDYLDDDGNLVEEECPAYIEVVNQPLKTEYTDGDSINLTGLAVLAYKADGSLWTQGNNGEVGHYAHGRIPNKELKLSDSKADSTKASSSSVIEYNGNNVTLGDWYLSFGSEEHNSFRTLENAQVVTIRQNDHVVSFYAISYSGVNAYRVVHTWDIIKNEYTVKEYLISFNYDVDTGLYYTELNNTVTEGSETYPNLVYSPSASETTLKNALLTIKEGEKKTEEYIQDIDVEWESPCGLEPLKTSFSISVKQKGHNGGTTISGNYGGSHYSGKF